MQAFSFLVRDRRLQANVGSAQEPVSLSKYLIRSPNKKKSFLGKLDVFGTIVAPWLEHLRGLNCLE